MEYHGGALGITGEEKKDWEWSAVRLGWDGIIV